MSDAQPDRRLARLVPPGAGVVVVFILIIGSPWVAEAIFRSYARSVSVPLGWLYYLLLFPDWRLAPGGNLLTWPSVLGSDVQALLLAAGAVFLAQRLGGLAGSPLGRLLGMLGAVILAAAVAALAGGIVAASGLDAAQRARAGGTIGYDLQTIAQGAFFGVGLGLLAGLAAAWRGGHQPGRRGLIRHRVKGVTVETRPLPADGGTGDATRYLCVAARLDERFTERVVDEIVAERMRAVALPAGVGLGPVVRHSLAAWRQHQERDLRLAAVFVLMVVIAPLWALLGAVCLGITGLGARKTLSRQPGRRPQVQLGLRHTAAVACVLVAALALAAVLRLSLGSPGGWAGWLLGVPWLGIVILIGLAGLYGLAISDQLLTRQVLVSRLRREVFEPAAAPHVHERQEWLASRVAEIEQAAGGNVSIYSGYDPFVGFGAAVSNWSFALPIAPAAGPRTIGGAPPELVPFTALDLIAHLRAWLEALAGDAVTPGGPGVDALAALRIEDRVFVSGRALAADGRFLASDGTGPKTPVSLTRAELDEIALQPQGAIRHYLCAHLPSWGGELMASTFFHVSTSGETLHIRCDRRLAGPVLRRYHEVDRMTGTMTNGQRRQLLVDTAGGLAGLVLGAPARAVRRALLPWRHDRRLLRDVASAQLDPGFDYGARISVRELSSDPGYQNYFQAVDVAKYFSIVERQALAAILEFLDEHGVDTADFRAQQLMILNQGIIQSGGVSVVGSQAVGSGSQAAGGSVHNGQPVAAAGGPAA